MRSRATEHSTASTELVESFEVVLTAAPAARAG
jgi:hypothetical protein